MKSIWLISCFFATSIMQAQTIRGIPVQIRGDEHFSKSIQFFCTQKYNRQHCVRDAIRLQLILGRYPVADLGSWNFVLASSDEWKDLVRGLGGIPGSPAFSVLENRTTVLEEALFSASGSRRAELVRIFGTVDRVLLEQAVSHELGHALCGEFNENRAAQNGHDLFTGRALVCQDRRQGLSADPKRHSCGACATLTREVKSP
jgi:hypothetical protein